MHFNNLARICFIVVTFFSLQFIAFAQTATPDVMPGTASISGRVTIGGKPAVGKKVMVTEVKPNDNGLSIAFTMSGGEIAGSKGFGAVTDAGGQYRVTGLPAGDYEVSVARTGAFIYSKEQGRRSRRVALDDGEGAQNVDFTLVRGGVITGRLTDPDGKPVIGESINIRSADQSGGYLPSGDFNGTDDRGIYRIYGLPAGRYLVSFNGAQGRPFGNSNRKYLQTFHPDVTDEAQATVIEVKEGSEVTDVDIKLRSKLGTYEATGRVIDSETGKPLSQGMIFCLAVDTERPQGGNGPSVTMVESQGNFRLTGLVSGKYSLRLNPGGMPFGQNEYYTEPTNFEVLQGNISGIEVRAKRGATIAGIAVVEDDGNPALKNRLDQTMITAQFVSRESSRSMHEFFDGGIAKINSDGSFQISGLPPGTVVLRPVSMGNSSGRFVLRVERDGVDVRNGIEVKPGETIAGVRLVIVYGQGTIRGEISFVGGGVSEGRRVMVFVHRIEDNNVKSFSDSDVTIQPDNKGKFVIEGLVDGEYEVMATLSGSAEGPPGGSVDGREDSNDSGTATAGPPLQVFQRVRVVKGRETPVNLRFDLSKQNQENK